jgi:hypothetical protein
MWPQNPRLRAMSTEEDMSRAVAFVVALVAVAGAAVVSGHDGHAERLALQIDVSARKK